MIQHAEGCGFKVGEHMIASRCDCGALDDAVQRAREIENALNVIVRDPKIRAFLFANDPNALEQAIRALAY